MDVGAELRDARQQRGISLDELSRATKINRPTLRALEGNDIDKLPGEIFVRGFLRAYAREVGLDIEGTVRRYLEQFRVHAQPVSGESERVRTFQPSVGPIAGNDRRWTALVGLALLIVLASYLVASRFAMQTSESDIAAPRTTDHVQVGTSGRVDPDPSAPNDEVVRLEFSASEPCWVSATADGERVFYQLMQGGERRTIEARNEIVLRIGNAGAFIYQVNGTPGRLLGGAGQAVTFRITPQNYREYLAPAS